MLDKQDVVTLQGMFDKTINHALKKNNEILRYDLKREILDETRALVVASENRVISSITEFIDTSILPQIADLQQDMVLVKRHLKLA